MLLEASRNEGKKIMFLSYDRRKNQFKEDVLETDLNFTLNQKSTETA